MSDDEKNKGGRKAFPQNLMDYLQQRAHSKVSKVAKKDPEHKKKKILALVQR